MHDRYVEKSFIFLVVLSLVLHAAVLALYLYFPHKTKEPPPQEPVFVDLQDVPLPKQQEAPPLAPEVKRYSDQRVRVPREQAPKGDDRREQRATQRPIQQARPAPQPQPRQTETSSGKEGGSTVPEKSQQPPVSDRREGGTLPGSSASGLLKPRGQQAQPTSPVQPQLFPSASRLAKLEESYRKRFEKEIAEGETKFLNSEDMLFGSFLRRFENAVYGVWRYPQEAAIRGEQGITPVRITFNRDGSINYGKTQLLESSGSRILDDEVMRTLRAIGPVGSLPKGYDKEEFHLIAFFQYGMSRKALR